MLKNLISYVKWSPVITGVGLIIIAMLVMIAIFYRKEMQNMKKQDDEAIIAAAGFEVQQKVRLDVTQDWNSTGVSDVKVGDIIQFQAEYRNLHRAPQEHVVMSLSWNKGLEFVPGSVRLCNTDHRDGDIVPDPTLEQYDNGGAGFTYDLGDYITGANVFLQFSAVVTEVNANASACFAAVKNGNVTLSSATVVEFAKSN